MRSIDTDSLAFQTTTQERFFENQSTDVDTFVKEYLLGSSSSESVVLLRNVFRDVMKLGKLVLLELVSVRD